ncbi:MAG: hypothetical protein CMJ06_01160 [Pelagibacterales bacterium]|nr:hypothetical protein [Pelagibacterales bacterium]OUU63473.1 MAG: hypothetical protein CBC22_01130 [Alphaproteobacteria bacterium TMED62]|tara:strand:- start:19576 stop:20022 length:447 start_codon:yes stop_codon:yes gene_type:complete
MKNKKISIFVIITFFLSILISCQPRITKHGNFFNQKNIKLIKKTKLNKSEVIAIFGEPTVKSTFSNNVWYYITLIQHEKAYFEVKNLKNKVLIITFDENQLVKKYKILTEEDSLEINLSNPKEASNNQNELSLLQEFFSMFTRKLDIQ